VIRTQLDSGVLSVVLDRPEKRNAMTVAMREELEALPRRCAEDREIRCVLLTGAGGYFSAGADLSEIRELRTIPTTNPAAGLAAIAVPTVAVIDGLCVTGGLEIALACDMILALPTARFRDTHVAMGVVPRWGMSVRLPSRVGAARASELSLSGRWIAAEEADRWGLVNRIVDSMQDGIVFAQAIAAAPAGAADAMIGLLRRGSDIDVEAALEQERRTSEGFGLG
jgi:enoyl-CoA hydratase